MNWLFGCLIDHEFHASQAKNVGELMRIHKYPGGAAGTHCPDEFRHGDHPGLDVHVGVKQTRCQKASARLYDLCLLPNAVAGIRTYKSYATAFDGNIGIWDDLAGLHANPAATPNHKVGRRATHCHVDQRTPQFERSCHLLLSVD
jgi:hypothetical protein